MAKNYLGYTGDSSGHPTGNILFILTNTLAYTNTTAKTMFTIPAGAYVIQWIVNVSTIFNSSGTDLIDIGVSGTVQKFGAALNVAATGQFSAGFVASQVNALQATDQIVIATYNQSVSDATTGALSLTAVCRIP